MTQNPEAKSTFDRFNYYKTSVWEKIEQSQKKDDKLKRKDHKGQIPLAPTQQKDKVQLEIKMRKGLDRQKRKQN